MKNVLVIGSGGAGKSTFSRHLGQLFNIEVIHLDALYWHPGWIETPRAEWRKVLEELLRRDEWIIDGNYSNTLALRLEKCDTVIFLDIARQICLWRVLKRAILYRGRTRPDMAEGCRERLDWGVHTLGVELQKSDEGADDRDAEAELTAQAGHLVAVSGRGQEVPGSRQGCLTKACKQRRTASARASLPLSGAARAEGDGA